MKKLNIALVAHDARKQELIEWCTHNAAWLNRHTLYGTGTTARLLNQIMVPVQRTEGFIAPDCEALPLTVKPLLSGPLAGDQQIGAMIAEGKIDVLIFFCDNLTRTPTRCKRPFKACISLQYSFCYQPYYCGFDSNKPIDDR